MIDKISQECEYECLLGVYYNTVVLGDSLQ
jgi:hypothetical protein